MLKKTKITKKTILITGASQGIGETSAIKFLNEGYNVALMARNKKKLESNFKNFKKPYKTLLFRIKHKNFYRKM